VVAFFRVLVAFLMIGEVEEYRDTLTGGRLLA
jgi:endo-alpha-1,4-polygalactosaminidase (GH114 family)